MRCRAESGGNLRARMFRTLKVAAIIAETRLSSTPGFAVAAGVGHMSCACVCVLVQAGAKGVRGRILHANCVPAAVRGPRFKFELCL